MRKITSALCTLALLFSLSIPASAAPLSKAQKRIVYTIKKLNLNATQQKELAPVLTSYLAEVKEAKKTYSILKDKYKNDIENGTLTDNAAKALLEAKFDFDAKETEIKKAYLKKLSAVIPYKKVYRCYDLINDKMSKVEGTKGKKNDADDDDD